MIKPFSCLIGVAAALAFWLCSPFTAPAAPAGSAKPNFVIILADDMGFSDPGCYGGEIQTPNLDRLAANGLRFTQFYNTARCWPTRSSLLTGYYAQQIGMDPPKGKLPPWTRVLPRYLKPLGYRCYHSGKWHLLGAPRSVVDGGFDHSYRFEDWDRYFLPSRHFEDDRPLPPVKPDSGYYATTAFADHAINYLQDHATNHAAEPFFLYLAFISPHFPLHALPEDIARYRDRYLAGWDVIREQACSTARCRRSIPPSRRATSSRRSWSSWAPAKPSTRCRGKRSRPNRRLSRPPRWPSTRRWWTGWTGRSGAWWTSSAP